MWLDLYRQRAAAVADPTVAPPRAARRPSVIVGAGSYYAGTSYVLGDSLYIEQGFGASVRAGIEVTSEIAAFVSVGQARIRTADASIGPISLTTVDVGVVVDAPGPPPAVNPYVRLAATFQTATADGTAPGTGAPVRYTTRGGGGTVGFGVLLALTPRVALDLSADVTLGMLRELAPEGAVNPACFCSRSARLGVGLVVRL